MTDHPNPSPEQLALLVQIIRGVARHGRLHHNEAEDFAQAVQMRFVERRYDVFERFEGRSSLRTYLTVVVSRLLLDWRNSRLGKWRPSRAALASGEEAIGLERLTSRDGYSRDEAVEIMCGRKPGRSRTALHSLAEQLPVRVPRRIVSDAVLQELPGAPFEDPIAGDEAMRGRRRLHVALAAALRALPSDDRWLIRARYVENRSVQAVALALNTNPQRLYRRYERLLKSLRAALAGAGVGVEAMADAYCVSRPARGPLLSRTGA